MFYSPKHSVMSHAHMSYSLNNFLVKENWNHSFSVICNNTKQNFECWISSLHHYTTVSKHFAVNNSRIRIRNRLFSECTGNTLIIWSHIVEQITIRIVQIMIQATDLAQILYGGYYSRKKCGPRKISIWPPFFKMATMGILKCYFLPRRWQ